MAEGTIEPGMLLATMPGAVAGQNGKSAAREGTLEALCEGKTTAIGAGSLFFIAPQDLHGVKNVGQTPATYFVIKWWPPGMLNTKA